MKKVQKRHQAQQIKFLIPWFQKKINLRLENGQKKNIPIVLFDMSFINKTLNEQGIESVSGIIGSDLLKKGKAIIDYSDNKLFLKS